MKLVGVAVILFASLALASTQTFTTLYNFPGGTNGANPAAGLLLSGGTLYGTTSTYDSGSGYGTVFKVNADGSGFTVLKNFSPLVNNTNSDGAYPDADLVLSGGTLYGTTSGGGSSGNGTVFSLVLRGPPLTLIRSGANAIFTWPTNPSGLTLQCATNLVTSVVWKTNLPAPVVVNGRNTVTNPITGKQQFFRLISN